MKTSVIEVHNMLSVLSVEEVEKRIGEVPGVESVTVNFAAESATVRYDETRLDIVDIKSAVRQRGYESAAPAADSAHDTLEGHTAPEAPPATAAAATPNAAPAGPVAEPAPVSAAPDSVPPAATATAAASDAQPNETVPEKS